MFAAVACYPLLTDWAADHCKHHYTSENTTGWFGFWDVDEFVFPCRRSHAFLPSNYIWDAYNASTDSDADGHEMRCSIFGLNNADVPQPVGQSVLLNHVLRAPDTNAESAAAAHVLQATRDACGQCGYHCCEAVGIKTIFRASKVRHTGGRATAIAAISACLYGLHTPFITHSAAC